MIAVMAGGKTVVSVPPAVSKERPTETNQIVGANHDAGNVKDPFLNIYHGPPTHFVAMWIDSSVTGV